MKNSSSFTSASASSSIAKFDFENAGLHLTRFGLVVVLLWIGGMKFTAYEAEGIKPFVENSPFMSFAYHVFSVRGFSALLGAVEIIVGLAIASRFWAPRCSAAGSLLATGMFLTTLSFLLTTPGIFEPSAGGFPAISFVGGFVLKDIVLLGASLLTFGEALKRSLRSDARTESDSSK